MRRIVGLGARLAACRTLARMTPMRRAVMAFGRQPTWLRALGRTRLLLATAGHLDAGLATSAFDDAALRTWIALAEVTECAALVLVAGQRFAAHLVARWTILIATLQNCIHTLIDKLQRSHIHIRHITFRLHACLVQ